MYGKHLAWSLSSDKALHKRPGSLASHRKNGLGSEAHSGEPPKASQLWAQHLRMKADETEGTGLDGQSQENR